MKRSRRSRALGVRKHILFLFIIVVVVCGLLFIFSSRTKVLNNLLTAQLQGGSDEHSIPEFDPNLQGITLGSIVCKNVGSAAPARPSVFSFARRIFSQSVAQADDDGGGGGGGDFGGGYKICYKDGTGPRPSPYTYEVVYREVVIDPSEAKNKDGNPLNPSLEEKISMACGVMYQGKGVPPPGCPAGSNACVAIDAGVLKKPQFSFILDKQLKKDSDGEYEYFFSHGPIRYDDEPADSIPSHSLNSVYPVGPKDDPKTPEDESKIKVRLSITMWGNPLPSSTAAHATIERARLRTYRHERVHICQLARFYKDLKPFLDQPPLAEGIFDSESAAESAEYAKLKTGWDGLIAQYTKRINDFHNAEKKAIYQVSVPGYPNLSCVDFNERAYQMIESQYGCSFN